MILADDSCSVSISTNTM